MDFFVITEGDNAKHVRAIAENIVENLALAPLRQEGMDPAPAAQWIALDYGDWIVHVFQREARRFYDLEGLWGEEALSPTAAQSEKD